jgi:hypothetical protein
MVFNCVAFGESGFVAAGQDANGGFVLQSDDGSAWNQVASPANAVSGVTFGQGAYVAVGRAGSILRSTDGRTWSQQASGESQDLGAIAFGQGRFVVAGSSITATNGTQQTILISPDGIHWSSQLLSASNYDFVTSVGFGNGKFVAGGAYGSVWSSSDGNQWAQSQPSSQFGYSLTGIAFGPGLDLVVGGRPAETFALAAGIRLWSTDGLQWSSKLDLSIAPLQVAAYGNGFYVTAGSSGGAIYSSEDGLCWAARQSPVSEGFGGAAFGANTFVLVGTGGTILQSGVVDTNAVRVRFGSCEPYSVLEQDGDIAIPVYRLGDKSNLARVHYSTVNGTAVAGTNYDAVAGILTFTPGQTNAEIKLHLHQDYLPRGPQTFSVALQDPLNGVEISPPSSASVEIMDIDSAHLDHWVQSVPLLSECCLSGLAFGNGTFVAAGSRGYATSSLSSPYEGVLLYSTDGEEWQEAAVSTPGTLSSVTWGGGNFVALAGDRVLSSSNGIVWAEIPLGTNYLEGLCFGNDRFVAVGPKVAWSSPDGIQWKPTQLPDESLLQSVAWSGDRFVGVGVSYSTNGVVISTVLSSSDGEHWMAARPLPGQSLASIAYANGTFVATGSTSRPGGGLESAIVTSSDGLTWTPRYSGDLILSLASSVNGGFVVVGTDYSESIPETMILTSIDGLAWSLPRAVPWTNPGAIAFGNGRYLLAGAGIWSSSDLVDWQEQVSGAVDLEDIAYAEGVFVAVGSMILTSPDGSHWTPRSSTLPAPLGGVAYGNGMFIAPASDGTILSSVDGTNWMTRASGQNAPLTRAAYGNGRFVVLGRSPAPSGFTWTNRVLVSTDGLQWTETYSDSGSADAWQDVTYGQDQFVIVGRGVVLSSRDGASWVTPPEMTDYPLNAITFANGIFVAVGGTAEDGRYCPCLSTFIGTSPDGTTWTPQSIPAQWGLPQGFFSNGWPLTGVTFGGGTFVAVGTGAVGSYGGQSDVIMTSADGVNWTTRSIEFGPGINRIASDGMHLVAVAQGPRVFRPGVVLSNAALPSSGNPGLSLNISSEIGLRVELQASTNLVDWRVLTNLDTTAYRTPVVISPTTQSAKQFLRTRLLP